MTTQTTYTPGAMSAAGVILRQVERLVDKPLALHHEAREGIAAIIDAHTAAPEMLRALGAMVAAFVRHPGNAEERHHALTIAQSALALTRA